MAGKPLDIHRAALAEFRLAVTWYLEWNQTAAVKFVAEVDRGVELLVKSPARWPAGEHGTRKFV